MPGETFHEVTICACMGLAVENFSVDVRAYLRAHLGRDNSGIRKCLGKAFNNNKVEITPETEIQPAIRTW